MTAQLQLVHAKVQCRRTLSRARVLGPFVLQEAFNQLNKRLELSTMCPQVAMLCLPSGGTRVYCCPFSIFQSQPRQFYLELDASTFDSLLRMLKTLEGMCTERKSRTPSSALASYGLQVALQLIAGRLLYDLPSNSA